MGVALSIKGHKGVLNSNLFTYININKRASLECVCACICLCLSKLDAPYSSLSSAFIVKFI